MPGWEKKWKGLIEIFISKSVRIKIVQWIESENTREFGFVIQILTLSTHFGLKSKISKKNEREATFYK